MTTPFSYPDPRGARPRQVDSLAARAQSAALTDSGMNPHATINERIDDIRRDRLATVGLVRDDPPILFDVLPDPGSPPGQPNMGIRILVARGEMLLSVAAPGGPGPQEGPGSEEGAGPRGDAYSDEGPQPWEEAQKQLLQRDYQRVGPEVPVAAPLLRYRSGRTPRQLLEDRDEIRAATGAEMDLNYVVTAGHVVKADDYARGTAARREWLSPDPPAREVVYRLVRERGPITLADLAREFGAFLPGGVRPPYAQDAAAYVLRLLAAGLSNAGIAAELVLSERTIDAHLRSVFGKLELPDSKYDNRRVQAAAIWASESHLLAHLVDAKVSQAGRIVS